MQGVAGALLPLHMLRLPVGSWLPPSLHMSQVKSVLSMHLPSLPRDAAGKPKSGQGIVYEAPTRILLNIKTNRRSYNSIFTGKGASTATSCYKC